MARGSNKNNRRNFQTKRKKFSIYKGKSNKNLNYKRKYLDENQSENLNNDKRTKIESNTENQISSSSESEDEQNNPLTQLLSTFTGNKIKTNVDTDDSEDSKLNDTNDELEFDDSFEQNDSVESISDVKSEGSNKEIPVQVPEQEVVEENEIDQETLNEDENLLATKDPFVQHLSFDLSDDLLDALKNAHKKVVHNIEWPCLGKLQVILPTCKKTIGKQSSFSIAEEKTFASLGKIPNIINTKSIDFDDLHIKKQIHNHIKSANKEIDQEDSNIFTEFQSEIFSVVNNYQDLYYCERNFVNGEEIRFIYCLHTINHILKTRTKVLHHNAGLAKRDDVPEEFRDQGLVRPKVLILVPFRNSALKIVQMLIDLLVPQEAGQVINKNRFMDEFTGAELHMPKKNPKPEDYELNFAGNCDDTFKIGIQVTKKSLKLYADFYSSDIIIASPLGLRLVVGAEGESERDHDFLASIELLILDQTELFLMQNWDHLIHILEHLHIQPKKSHGTDFARVRTWALNGWSRYYRQTLIFSSIALPEINAIFNRRCINYSGAVRSMNPIKIGSITNVHVQVPQIFRKFQSDNVLKAIEARFEFFIHKVLPQYKDSIMKNCLIYVPSYFDFVKIRNYFKREDVSFVQICEYTKDPKIARARDMFFHGDKHFLLYSERFHYFRRIRIKGIRHVIFYQPPIFPHFYSEICNFMQEANQNKKSGSISNMTVTVIYSKYDSHQMAAILGTDRLTKLAASTNNFHMFTSSDS